MADSKKRLTVEDVNLGARIRAVRLAVKKTQQQVAEGANVSLPQYSKYEHGLDRLSWGKICAVAAALEVPLSVLLAPFLGENGASTEVDYQTKTLGSYLTADLLEQWGKIPENGVRQLVYQLTRLLAEKASRS